MSTADEQKRAAAQAALAYLPQEGVVGLGTGSTARYFIDGVARLVAEGRKLTAVATSKQSERQARELGIPMLDDAGPWPIAVTVDGADEVSARLDLIKGGGAAHTREKIVNFSSKMNLIVVDESKLSSELGERWAVPLEVLAFGAQATAQRLAAFGPVQQRLLDGRPVMTDAGNFIFDLRAGVIACPSDLDTALRSLPGVVETGLFCGRADVVLVATKNGVQTLTAPTSAA